MSKPLAFTQERLFRETEGVHFSDINVPGQNGLDLVVHSSYAVSPDNCRETGNKRFYTHNHQTDNNRCINGSRVFELVATEGQLEHEHYLVRVHSGVGALEIPPRVYHRSVSCKAGSILLNHAIRDEDYDEKNEFHPVASHQDQKLQAILEKNQPVYVNGTEAQIQTFLQTGEYPAE